MIFKIDAAKRTTQKKAELTKLRKDGFIPGIVYGRDTEPVNITLDRAEFMKLYKKSFTELVFYEIKVGRKNYHTLMKERQIHPVSREILHVDFMVIPHDQEIEIDIPIKYVGTAKGIKEGGSMDVVIRTLRIQCLDKNMPEDIEVDISSLEVGDVMHVSQIPVGKWTVKDNPDQTLVTIHAKKIEVEPVAEEVPVEGDVDATTPKEPEEEKS
jgi:large subunit ribosomal protein L25